MSETSKAILAKVSTVNDKLSGLDAPENVIIAESDSLTTQQKNIQPASDWLNQTLKDLNQTLDSSELTEMVNSEIEKIRKFVTDKIEAMAAEFAQKSAEKAAKALIPIPIPEVPPAVKQIADMGKQLQSTLEDRILSMTINMELKKNIMTANRIKKARSKK